MKLIDKVGKAVERFFDWLGLTSPDAENAYADALIAPYDAKQWPTCKPRIGETFERYRARARQSQERALLEEIWRVTATPDETGVWKTNVDSITRARDSLLNTPGWPA